MTARAAATEEPVAPPDAAEEPRLLTRAAILEAEDITYQYVDVPEWGGRIRVRSLTGAERDAYDAESFKASQTPTGSALDMFRIRRVGRAIVDENGIRVFSDKDFAALGAKSGAAIDRIDDVVVAMSRLTDEEVDKAKADLKVVPSDGSGSD